MVVLGLGRFGKSLALELMSQGTEVLGIDSSDAVVQKVAHRLTHAVVADTTDEESLRQLSVHEYGRAVVGIGSDLEASLLTASALINLGVHNIWA
ncbi:NAD-binding protein, partial [Rhodococcus aetherivorans]|uniref:NAD-binding protein n=2 Tax=Nocardiaceae TaxID=85025 RepID=UPI0036C8F19B